MLLSPHFLLLLLAPLLATTTHATCTTPTCSPHTYQNYNLTSRATLHKGLNWILGNRSTSPTPALPTATPHVYTSLDRATFFRDYYEQRPLAILRNDPTPHGQNYYGNLFPFDACASVIDNFPDQRKNDDWVIVNKNFITPKSYTKLREYYNAYLQGNTLGMFILNRLYPTLGVLVDDLDADFGFPWRVNLYLTPRGAKGFLPHTDQHDFFILQTGGRKKWRIYGNPIPLNTRNQEQGKVTGKPLLEKNLGKPLLEVVLEQGDALYVPRGYIHVAETFPDTGSLHLTVRGTNSFFFNMGHVFNAALPTPPPKLGLPKLSLLQELDVEFRRSTPIHWLDVDEESSDGDASSLDTSKSMQALMHGVQHGGDELNLCQRSGGRESGCVMNPRWIKALIRAGKRYRKKNKHIGKASKIKIKQWFKKNLDMEKGISKLKVLRNKINVEHHKLLKHVENIFVQKNHRYDQPNFPLDQWLRIKKSKDLMLYKSKKKKNGNIWVLQNTIVGKDNQKIVKKHEFRHAMKSVLDEVMARSTTSDKPFRLKEFKSSTDNFERISLMHVLYYDLKILDKLEMTKQEKKKRKKKKKKGTKKDEL